MGTHKIPVITGTEVCAGEGEEGGARKNHPHTLEEVRKIWLVTWVQSQVEAS